MRIQVRVPEAPPNISNSEVFFVLTTGYEQAHNSFSDSLRSSRKCSVLRPLHPCVGLGHRYRVPDISTFSATMAISFQSSLSLARIILSFCIRLSIVRLRSLGQVYKAPPSTSNPKCFFCTYIPVMRQSKIAFAKLFVLPRYFSA